MKLENLLKLLMILKPDIIHIHGTEGPYILMLQEKLSIPIIVSIQGILTVIEQYYFSNFPKSSSFLFSSLKNIVSFTFPFIHYRNLKKRAIRERQCMQFAKYISGRTTLG